MLPTHHVTATEPIACAVCERDGAAPCEDCGIAVCELHGAGYRWAGVHHTSVLPHLCTVCETTRLLEDDRVSRQEANLVQAARELAPSSVLSPDVELLTWARTVWPTLTRDDTGVTVTLQVREIAADLDSVKAKVVALLGRIGLAGVPDSVLAPWLWAMLDDADIEAVGEVPVARRFFAGYTTERGHNLLPLAGRLEGAPRVFGAVLTREAVLWGQFAIDDGLKCVTPVGGFEERSGCGALGIGLLSAAARLVPQQLLG